MKASYLLLSIAALALFHSAANASKECMATINGLDAVTLAGFFPGGDGKEITTTVKPGQRFIAAPPYDTSEQAWRVYLKSGIEGRIDRDRLRLLPDEPLMKLNYSASKRVWRKAKSRQVTENDEAAWQAKQHGVDYYDTLIRASEGDLRAMARFDSLGEFMDGAAGESYHPEWWALFHVMGDENFPVTLRAGRQRPGNDTRVLSALLELTASIRFGTRGHISNRISRRPTKYCSARDNDLVAGLRMNGLKILATYCALLLSAALSLTAGERIDCKSPDGKFALRETFNELNPIHGDSAIIESGTRKVAVQLHGDEPAGTEKLVWSKDSRRVASFRYDWKNGATKIFFRDGAMFEEIKMPELPSPQLPDLPKPDGSNGETIKRVEPIRWLESGDLLLESELQNKAGARAALQITVGFEQRNQSMVRKSEKEKMSVLDYFLLMPPDTYEGPAFSWLNVMRANGEVIDKENGYMSCPGDGAQPEFELALFRYRDGRPLLALCNGDLEGTDSVQLRFFELGADGKMNQISGPVLPGADLKNDPGTGYVKEGWQFELPRTGKTIRVRAQKDGKLLHRFTWDGAEFVEQR